MPRRPDGGTGALRRIRDTGAIRAVMDTNAMRTLMDTATMQMLRERYAGRGKLVVTVAVVFWVLVAGVSVSLALHRDGGGKAAAGPKASASARVIASAGSTAGWKPSGTASATKKPGSASGHTSTGPARLLTVAGAEAFGPSGTSDGDNPTKAALALSGNPATPWRTHEYATAHFGDLQQGTGLVLDMGHVVTVSKVTLELATGSATVTIRVGNTPVPGTFTPMAQETGAGGTMTLAAAKPLRGRYIEIWFSLLPRDSAGTYRESVYGVKVTGQP
jgi:putative peptidoglycan lipid II flippase